MPLRRKTKSTAYGSGLPKHVIQITVWVGHHRSSEYSDTCLDDFHTVHEFSQQDYALETLWLEYVEQCESWEIKPEDCVSEFDFKSCLTSMGVFEDANQPEIGIYQCCDKSYYVDTKTRALYRHDDILGQSHVYHRWVWDEEGRVKLRAKGANFGGDRELTPLEELESLIIRTNLRIK